ncbi:hypothetical protein F4780DRAFT_298416 [Xylariomycetidae sp. FL0641]|nr:hypothetical protein F4780DRAFT_298416 [Xylariomycetidae sp. FL0641]
MSVAESSNQRDENNRLLLSTLPRDALLVSIGMLPPLRCVASRSATGLDTFIHARVRETVQYVGFPSRRFITDQHPWHRRVVFSFYFRTPRTALSEKPWLATGVSWHGIAAEVPGKPDRARQNTDVRSADLGYDVQHRPFFYLRRADGTPHGYLRSARLRCAGEVALGLSLHGCGCSAGHVVSVCSTARPLQNRIAACCCCC